MRSRNAARLGLAAAVVLPVLLLACQKPRVLLVGTELPELTPVVSRALASDTAVGRWTVLPDTAPVPARAVVVRLTTTPGWNLDAPGLPVARIPDSWRAGRAYAIPASLDHICRPDGSSWESIPLLFDAWGQTRLRPGVGARATPILDWARLVSRGAPATAAAAGSRPSFRQWALIAVSADPAARVSGLPAWFTQAPKGWEPELRALVALKQAAVWAANTWHYADADLLHGFPPSAPLAIMATFRDYELSNWSGPRSFSPFVISGPSGTLLGGPVVFAELRGEAAGWKDAAPLLRLLSAVAFQKQAAVETKWLPANLEAPELDDTGSAVRYLVRQAQAFAPLTDRLPQPLAEGNLWVEAQLAVDRASK